MKSWKKIGLLISSIIIVLVLSAVFLINQFLTSLQPPKIEITENYISTNQNFTNAVTLEKISVDSIGRNGLPVKYTVNYWTRCYIDLPKGRAPEPPNKIVFSEKGDYWWIEEESDIQYIHKGLQREKLGENNSFPIRLQLEMLPTCPLKFEREQWYFITVGDPQVTGIFFIIDEYGKEHQYMISSGVSPI